MAKEPKRHLRAVEQQVTLDTAAFDSIPDEDELDALLDEVSDEEFGQPQLKDPKPVKLKQWVAEDFASIYVRFRPHLERHARKYLTNPSQIDEVVQDAFLYLMVSLPELDSEIGVLKFLKWKVKNLCLDIYRAQGRAYVKSIDDVAEPESNDAELGSQIEMAEDAAVVKLALSKLNPRHREVLVASIYEELSTAEIAAQVGLSENATLQLLYRARGAFKKALLGDVDTDGMSMASILSVAARKAAEDAKKFGVQAMVLVLFVVLGVGALFNFNRNTPSGQVAQIQPSTQPSPQPDTDGKVVPDQDVTEHETGTKPTRVVVAPATSTNDEVPLVEDFYERNEISATTASSTLSANSNGKLTVYLVSKADTTHYAFQGAAGISGTFTYDGFKVTDLVFKFRLDGFDYKAYAQKAQTMGLGSGKLVVSGTLSDLVDLNNLVYDSNALSKANFSLNLDLLTGNSGLITLN